MVLINKIFSPVYLVGLWDTSSDVTWLKPLFIISNWKGWKHISNIVVHVFYSFHFPKYMVKSYNTNKKLKHLTKWIYYACMADILSYDLGKWHMHGLYIIYKVMRGGRPLNDCHTHVWHLKIRMAFENT